MSQSGGNFVVTFLWRADTADAIYDIRSSTDLQAPFGNGSTMTVYGVVDQSGLPSSAYERKELRLPMTVERGFVRMQATVLTQPTP